MIRKTLGVILSLVMGVMTAVSAMPVISCADGPLHVDCLNECSCDCEQEPLRLPICCLDIADMPDMIQPQPDTPQKVAALISDDGPIPFQHAIIRSNRVSRALSGDGVGQPLYRVYQVILC